MPGPYLIIVSAGDSNAGYGEVKLSDGSDDAGSGIFQVRLGGTIAVGNEPLDHFIGPGVVGSDVALCRLLRDGGYVPAGYQQLIVPVGWAGTSLTGVWNVSGNRYALDGNGAEVPGLYAQVAIALATHANSRIWFYKWSGGMNETTQTEAQYQANLTAMWNEVRNNVPTGKYAPLFVVGPPPNYVTLGGGSYPGVLAAQTNVANYLYNSHFINTSALTAISSGSGHIHHSAVAHRGGTNNAPGNVGEVVTVAASIAGLEYAKIQTVIRYPTRISWT